MMTDNRTILALDMGTATGWCIWNGKLISKRKRLSEGSKYKSLWKFLEFTIDKYKPDRIVIERLLPIGPVTPLALATLHGTLYTIKEVRYPLLEIEEMDVRVIRKWLLGRGNATKEEVRLEVQKRLNRNIDSLDESDAIALCFYARDH